MTRKELVEALEANFKPDEVVTFEYIDSDYGRTTETDVSVKDHTELVFVKNGRWEYYDGDLGKWVKGSSPIALSRWVPDGAISKVTKKVLYIGG